MSDYFGALMQSSGLSLERGAASRPGTLPQDPASPADYGIVEVEEQGSMVHSDASANKTEPLIPAQGQPGSAAGEGAVRPRVEIAPMPSVIQKDRPAATAPMAQVQEADSSDSVVADRRAHDEASSGENVPIRFHEKKPLPAGSAVVQAALRWVASGEDHTRVVPEPASVQPQRSDSLFVDRDVQAPQRVESQGNHQAGEERPDSARSPSFLRLGQPQAVEAPAVLQDSDQHRRVSVHDSGNDNAVEVTIGSINIRVDAPPPQAAAVTAPSPVPGGTAEAPARSGLSRRTLWRI
jgi:hypothetical protein